MAFLSFLQALAFAGLLQSTQVSAVSIWARHSAPSQSVNATCNQIAKAISSASDVYWPGSPQYDLDVIHYASSSSQQSVCSVEPGTPQDVGKILQIIGRTNTSFAVKGGGHTFNPGFSSTPGIQISMFRFQQINVGTTNGVPTVELGTGLVWDTVYTALDAKNMTVVGGRVTGVGVAGFTLGGGLSFLTNQHGIGTANIVALELVLPSGQVTTVTAKSNPDLFFAVRGTQNNFGIVTSITTKAYKQGLVWGGTNVYPVDSSNMEQIIEAVDFLANNVTDPKASSILAFDYQNNSLTLDAVLCYNDVTPPPGVFDKLLAITPLVNNTQTTTYQQVVLSSNGNGTFGERASLHHAMVRAWNKPLIEAVINQTLFWGERLLQVDPNAQILNPLEVFLPSMFQHGDPGAWPPSGANSPALYPQASQWSWTTGPETDDAFISAQRQQADYISQLAGSSNLPLYSNYALFGVPVESIYGSNMPRLERIKAKYDPQNIMGLAGGWKIPES